MKTKSMPHRDAAIVRFSMGSFAIKAHVSYEHREQSYDWQDDSYEPAETVLKSVEVMRVDNGDCAVWQKDRPDWFRWLNRLVRPFVEKNLVSLLQDR